MTSRRAQRLWDEQVDHAAGGHGEVMGDQRGFSYHTYCQTGRQNDFETGEVGARRYMMAIPLGLMPGGTISLAGLGARYWHVISSDTLRLILVAAVLIAAAVIVVRAFRPSPIIEGQ